MRTEEEINQEINRVKMIIAKKLWPIDVWEERLDALKWVLGNENAED